MAKGKIRGTLRDSLIALKGTVAAANRLVPGVIGISLLLGSLLLRVALLSVPTMMGVVVLIVVFSSVLVYGSTSNYGEAALALLAGLLTAFTVTWDSGNFIMFAVAWISFTFFALIISSLRLASAAEDIYRQAALSISKSPKESDLIEAELKRIGERAQAERLGPVERAEIIRIFAFRKMQVHLMSAALKASGMLVTITKLDYKAVGLFMADVYRLFNVENETQANLVLDHVYSIIREVPTSPQEFIQAYEASRSLALSFDVRASKYFQALRKALEHGVSPEDMREVLKNQFAPS